MLNKGRSDCHWMLLMSALGRWASQQFRKAYACTALTSCILVCSSIKIVAAFYQATIKAESSIAGIAMPYVGRDCTGWTVLLQECLILTMIHLRVGVLAAGVTQNKLAAVARPTAIRAYNTAMLQVAHFFGLSHSPQNDSSQSSHFSNCIHFLQ